MEITIDNIIDAIEKNGLPKTKYTFWRNVMGSETSFLERVASGCALGQASINLGVNPAFLTRALERTDNRIRERIIKLNDNTDLTLPEIAEKLREIYGTNTRAKKIVL